MKSSKLANSIKLLLGGKAINSGLRLQDLCGKHLLSGVDRENKTVHYFGDKYLSCSVLNFTLDGITYTACEDPADGYRSTMEYLKVSRTPTRYNFKPVKVFGRMDQSDGGIHDVLELVDSVTGKVVLKVGTFRDNYYPTFVANFYPQNMACNSKVVKDLKLI